MHPQTAEILCRDTCPACKGQGAITDSTWLKYYKADDEHLAEKGYRMDVEQLEEWFKTRGYYKIPQEESTCHSCKGEGKTRFWIKVSGFLKDLK